MWGGRVHIKAQVWAGHWRGQDEGWSLGKMLVRISRLAHMYGVFARIVEMIVFMREGGKVTTVRFYQGWFNWDSRRVLYELAPGYHYSYMVAATIR